MRRLYVHRFGGSIEITVRAFGRYFGFAATRGPGLYGNGRRWVVLPPTRCLCAWYGPDLYDGCSECGT